MTSKCPNCGLTQMPRPTCKSCGAALHSKVAPATAAQASAHQPISSSPPRTGPIYMRDEPPPVSMTEEPPPYVGEGPPTPESSIRRTESAPGSTYITIGGYDIGKRQLLGLIGSIVLFVGVFAPIISIPIRGNMNYFQNGRGDGTIVLILAVVSFILVMNKKYKHLLYTGLGSLGITLFTFISFQIRMSQARAQMERELANNPFKGLAELALGSVQLEWGWALLVIGAGLIVACAVMKEE